MYTYTNIRDTSYITKVLRVLDVDRLNNSVYGNPRQEIYAEDEDGKSYRGNTASDASIGYQLSSYAVGNKYEFVFHRTSTGKIIFDRMSDREIKDSIRRNRITRR